MSQKTKEFNKLQEKWYKKLKDKGFDDIETSDGRLKKWASSHIKRQILENGLDVTLSLINAKTEYFRAAESFLYDHKFSSSYEKRIWKMHTEGKTIRGIAKVLDVSSWEIFQVIKGLKNLCFPKSKAETNE